jgi:DNA polymerase-4
MDAFYASVEQRDDPSLRGRPVAVGGSPESRGVVAAASYEARAFGVRSALPMSRAVRLCPELVIVRPDFGKYGEASRQVFAIFREVTPLVEPLSLDEAYLDVTENSWGEPLAVDVARRIKARIREETRLTASAGVAPNKFLAKIASGWKKPDGLTVISPDRIESFLQKQPVRSRRASSARLASSGSSTSGRPTRKFCGRRSGAGPRDCAGSPSARTIGRSSRTRSASRSGAKRRSRKTWRTGKRSAGSSKRSLETPPQRSRANGSTRGRWC